MNRREPERGVRRIKQVLCVTMYINTCKQMCYRDDQAIGLVNRNAFVLHGAKLPKSNFSIFAAWGKAHDQSFPYSK